MYRCMGAVELDSIWLFVAHSGGACDILPSQNVSHCRPKGSAPEWKIEVVIGYVPVRMPQRRIVSST